MIPVMEKHGPPLHAILNITPAWRYEISLLMLKNISLVCCAESCFTFLSFCFGFVLLDSMNILKNCATFSINIRSEAKINCHLLAHIWHMLGMCLACV